MDFYKFTKFVLEHQNIGKKPPVQRYPKDLKLSSEIWTGVRNLFKFTSQFNYEHSISFYDCDGDVINTPPVKGSKSQVITRHSISFKYLHKVNDLYEKQISVDGKIVKKVAVRESKIPKQPAINQLFNFHSHPSHELEGKLHYSFYSGVDVSTLQSTTSLCMGLVTDELLIACKHSNSPSVLTQKQQQILHKINSHYFHYKQIPSELISELRLVIYSGQFGKKLKRI